MYDIPSTLFDFSFRKKKARPKTRPQKPRTGHPQQGRRVLKTETRKKSSQDAGLNQDEGLKKRVWLGDGGSARFAPQKKTPPIFSGAF
jgi:hypothetical protein